MKTWTWIRLSRDISLEKKKEGKNGNKRHTLVLQNKRLPK